MYLIANQCDEGRKNRISLTKFMTSCVHGKEFTRLNDS